MTNLPKPIIIELMISTITKIQNGTVKLPTPLSKKWQNVDIVVVPLKEAIILKRLNRPFGKLSDIALANDLPALSDSVIEKEIADYRQGR